MWLSVLPRSNFESGTATPRARTARRRGRPREGTMTHVDERQARKVAEEARETTWRQPSFGKQLFLGDLQLDLIHPHPQPTEEAHQRGEEFCARMLEFAQDHIDAALIEHNATIPDET